MNAKDIKLALSIKRQKKAGKLISGSVNVPLDQIGKFRKIKIYAGHKNKGGTHKQNGGPSNEYSK